MNEVLMITIRAHQVKRHIDPIDLDRICLKLMQEHHCYIHEHAYELDPTYKQLHAHGLATVPYIFQWITSIDGFRIYYRKVTPSTIPTCIRYIHKNWDQCHTVINDFQDYAFGVGLSKKKTPV